MSAAPIPDLDARRRALDPTQSCIVQAPAGSGKTELLIQRYLLLLACVDHPEEIVAVTFTKKAAGEMRERVLSALADAGAGKIPASEHEKLTQALATAALQRDAKAGWRIAENPARLRIQTIDSLCATLTRQMPMLSRFGSQPESIEDASELYLEAARATVELVESVDAVAQDLERLLVHLDNDVARIETLLADMLQRRDHWIRRIDVPSRDELEATLKRVRRAALEHVRNCLLHPLPGPLPSRERGSEIPLPPGGGEGVIDELLELVRYAAANLVAIGRNSPLVACDKLTELPGVDESAVAAWLGIAELLLTQPGTWRKQFIVSEGFPPGKTKGEKEASRRWKDRALALIYAQAFNEPLRAALHDLRHLPPPAYSEQQWEVLGAIMRLLPRALGEMQLVFQSHGQVDFTEVSQAALRALETDEGPTDLALAMDHRIRHLLIDEFQDTSISQYELVAKLTAGWDPDDGRSVFAVGDPMQSIYRFREAEVGLFLRARATGIGSVALQPINLSANFRSQAGIVAWVNATFGLVMPEHEDIATGAVSYTASIATRTPLAGSAVIVHPLFNDDRVAEAAKVLEIVTQARLDDPAGRIAILVRNRGHLREIVPLLKGAGLRFRALEIEELGHRPAVQDLLALTRALSHPGDRLAWLALLRTPWCGLTLADLHTFAADDHVRTIWELMNDAARVAALSANGRSRLLRVHAVLKECIAYRCRGLLRERVAGAWFALGGPACVEDTTDLEDAEIYFDYLEEHEEAGEIADPVAFEQGLTKLYALPDVQADERLQIMTIHKAKGLEFDTVIVPGLGRLSRHDDRKLFLWMEQPRKGERDATELLLAPIQETGADDDRIYAWLQKLDAEKESHEDERLLYVAATRARQRLHLLGHTRLAPDSDGVLELKPPAEKTLLGKLWPVVEPIYTAAATHLMESPSPLMGEGWGEGVISIDQFLRRLPSGWMLPAAPPPAAWKPPQEMARAQDEIEFSWVGETTRHIGSVVHRWLQRIAEDELRGWDVRRISALRNMLSRELIAHGVADTDLEGATTRTLAALTHAVTDERGRWLLGPQQDAANEHRLTAIIGGERMNLVIDRMFRDAEGRRWIVDYKTSSHEGADMEAFLDRERVRYQAQLERYDAAIGDGKRTMLGLYFPLLAGWREWEGR